MSENLATILTDTAERSGDQLAFKLDDVGAELLACSTRAARASRGC